MPPGVGRLQVATLMARGIPARPRTLTYVRITVGTSALSKERPSVLCQLRSRGPAFEEWEAALRFQLTDRLANRGDPAGEIAGGGREVDISATAMNVVKREVGRIRIIRTCCLILFVFPERHRAATCIQNMTWEPVVHHVAVLVPGGGTGGSGQFLGHPPDLGGEASKYH